MATLARLNVILGLTTTSFTKGLENAQKKLTRFGRQMDRTGRRLTTQLTVPLALAGTTAVKMSLSFEDAMTKIITLVGVSEEQVKEWGKLLLDLGPELGKTPTELANALFQVTSAGYRGAEAIDVLTYAAKGSNLGLGETVVVADAVTSAINAWGKANLNAADATAILRAAVREGKAEADSIAPVIGTVANVAAGMGVQFHEVAAAIAVMTRTGAPAEIAVTQLSAILSTIQKGAPKTREALLGVGTSLQEVRDTLRGKGLIALLTTLVEKFGDNEDAAAGVFGNVRALRGLMGLVGAEAEENVKIFARLAQTTGKDLNEGLAVVAEKSGFKLAQVFAELSSAAITFGDAILPYVVPAAQKLGELVERLTTAFSELDPQVQKAILAILGIAAAAGPVLILVGLIASGLGALSLSFVGWTAAIAVAAPLIAKHWTAIKNAIGALVEFAKPALAELRDFVLQVFGKIKDFAIEVWPTIQSIIRRAVERISELWEKHGDTILRVLDRAWKVAKMVILATLDAVTGTIETLLHLLNNDWVNAFKTARDTVKSVFGTVVDLVKAALLRMSAGWYDFSASADLAMIKILATIRKVIDAWTKIPFIDPVQRKIGEAALTGIDAAMGAIAVRVAEAKLESQHLNREADKLIAPIEKAKTGLVEMRGEWVTISGAAAKAADETVISITRAGEEIKGTLKGGFGRGVEEGVEAAKISYDSLQQYVEDHPLRPEFDMEYIQRQFDAINRAPDTGGALP
jgi:TP901 family phage tail tape measure protein